jgi:hypothetical protein
MQVRGGAVRRMVLPVSTATQSSLAPAKKLLKIIWQVRSASERDGANQTKGLNTPGLLGHAQG